MLNNLDLFKTPPSAIHYCYGARQEEFQSMKERGAVFQEGIPETRELFRWFPKGGILIMDDLMDEGSGDKRILDLFTKYSYHQNVTVIYLCQDMFPTGRYAKSIARNAHYVDAEINWGCAICCCNPFLPPEKTPWTRFAKRPPALSGIC